MIAPHQAMPATARGVALAVARRLVEAGMMERVQEPHVRTGKEVRAEVERTQTELAATRRKIQELEQLVAARAVESAKWEARTRKQPLPQSENWRVALLVGVVLGVLMVQGFVVWRGGRMPASPPLLESKPEHSNPMPLFPIP